MKFRSNTEKFGLLVQLRASTGQMLSPKMSSWLHNSINFDYCKIVEDPLGEPMGYVVWAQINQESVSRFKQFGAAPAYSYEWDEGKYCLLLDIVLTGPYQKYGFRQIRKLLNEIEYILYKKGNKLLSWDRVKKHKLITWVRETNMAQKE